jgi:Fe-S-cluster containining protein
MEPGMERRCGDCSLCCTVLRVDAPKLKKLGGVNCLHQDVGGPGCAIHATRPQICRAYRCLWLGGGLEEAERPDLLGAVLDVVSDGATVRLEIREAVPGSFDDSERLQAIGERYRVSMPVRISDVGDVLDPDRPYRVLLPGGEEYRVRGEWTEVVHSGRITQRRRLSWIERAARRVILAVRRFRQRGMRGGRGRSSPGKARD